MSPVLFETPRLVLRHLEPEDAALILSVLNDPAFLRYVGDRGLRSVEDASRYIVEGPMASYQQFGYGMFRVDCKDDGQAIGICGLLKRDTLEHPDLGFALVRSAWSKGFAREAAGATMSYGRGVLGMDRILAITAPDNDASIALLEKIGFRFDRFIDFPGAATPRRLFVSETAVV